MKRKKNQVSVKTSDMSQSIHPDDPLPRSSESALGRFGWWSLLFYVVCGLVLEGLHGFKVGWYLDVGYETRRLMFTLGHAHGTLLSILTIVAAIWARVSYLEYSKRTRWSFRLAATLIPGGFLLGGVGVMGGDPGIGVWLVPIGALALLNAIASVARM